VKTPAAAKTTATEKPPAAARMLIDAWTLVKASLKLVSGVI
jgi:hypothetical protein